MEIAMLKIQISVSYRAPLPYKQCHWSNM